jgi:hypothetical protein
MIDAHTLAMIQSVWKLLGKIQPEASDVLLFQG